MTSSVRQLTRIALFAALIYVLSWSTVYLPNVNLGFFVAFTAGFLWGLGPGALVGALGMWLWTTFHPYGPVSLPITIAQVAGMAASGLVGHVYRTTLRRRSNPFWLMTAAPVSYTHLRAHET